MRDFRSRLPAWALWPAPAVIGVVGGTLVLAPVFGFGWFSRDTVFGVLRDSGLPEADLAELDRTMATGFGLTVLSVALAATLIGWSYAQRRTAALLVESALATQHAANEELAALSRQKDEFVSIVSHEFRTPLTGILGFSEMIRDEDLGRDEVREFAGDIHKDAKRLTRMVNDMLDLDRMGSGRMTMETAPLALNEVVGEAADLARANAPTHRIHVELDPGLPAVLADRDRMTQVVTNLLSNAVKYSPAGGEILLRTDLRERMAHLAVTDSGIGLPADSLERVFERFSRVESPAMRDIQGTGLGLPIVRQIVDMHGGRVWAESELGKGSTFHVTLPLAVPASRPSAMEVT